MVCWGEVWYSVRHGIGYGMVYGMVYGKAWYHGMVRYIRCMTRYTLVACGKGIRQWYMIMVYDNDMTQTFITFKYGSLLKMFPN